MQLTKKILIKGEIKALTGLLIGGSNTAMGIGGPDTMVIRNPVNNEPYIPGSSLKGKMRSLSEISKGKLGGAVGNNVKFGPYQERDIASTVLFGSVSKDTEKQRPARIIVRDGKLLNGEKLINTDLPYTESKTEVVIDRVTSAAGPRTIERVPAGAIFKLDLVINIVDDDAPFDQDALLKQTFRALEIVQDDYLGGSGSRGYGQVEFTIKSIVERSSEYYQGSGDENDITEAVASSGKYKLKFEVAHA
jgi:CRISPR-associated protein Csm3